MRCARDDWDGGNEHRRTNGDIHVIGTDHGAGHDHEASDNDHDN